MEKWGLESIIGGGETDANGTVGAFSLLLTPFGLERVNRMLILDLNSTTTRRYQRARLVRPLDDARHTHRHICVTSRLGF